MGYMHINNLYKDQTILMFRECYAMEKIHGTSARVAWKDGALNFYAGGCKHESFVSIFNIEELTEHFVALGHDAVTVFGEAYGGKLQGMSKMYGTNLRFIAFEVKIGDTWLNVGNACEVACKLGLEFVPYRRMTTDIDALNEERDRDSDVAIRRGILHMPREGLVLRPPVEFCGPNGERVIAKHKRAEFCETKTPREVGDNLAVLAAQEAAMEWVTDERLRHVLDALENPCDMLATPKVMSAMVDDVMREGAGEIEDTKETRKAIGRRTLELWKKHVKDHEQSALQRPAAVACSGEQQ